jgi:hypothetical protein
MSHRSKLTPRKVMRVATVFTGATACAAAFTPMAMAGTGHRGPVPMLHTGGQITSRSCPNANSYPTWFHMDSAVAGLTCFGYTGTFNWQDNNESVVTECGGNNVGWYSGTDLATKKHAKATYHEGTTFAILPGYDGWDVSKVHISGWSGNDQCSY